MKYHQLLKSNLNNYIIYRLRKSINLSNIVNLFRLNDDELEYVIETPNHKTGNLISNLAKVCNVETIKNEKDMKYLQILRETREKTLSSKVTVLPQIVHGVRYPCYFLINTSYIFVKSIVTNNGS